MSNSRRTQESASLLVLLLACALHAGLCSIAGTTSCAPADAQRRSTCSSVQTPAATTTCAAAAPAAAAAAAEGSAGDESQPASPVQLPPQYVTGEYTDEVHAEGDLAEIQIGDYGYKFRTIDGLVLPPYVTPKRLAAASSVKTRAGDICYCSFPKSGSTWLANVLYLMLHDGQEAEDDMPLRSNLHWMESSWTFPRSQAEVDALPSPRIFKSHMPLSHALGGGPGKAPCRYIYIARNPKDVAVSYWHFESNQSWSGGYNGPWEHWLQLFVDGKVQRGSWFDHVLSWWKVKDANNMLFLKYEDLKRDFPSQLRRIAKFTGHELSDAAFERVVNASSFQRMKQSRFANHQTMRGFEGFFRKGEIGSWKEQFTVAQSEAFDKLYKERMAGSGLEFEFE